jgi:hypothetical protein
MGITLTQPTPTGSVVRKAEPQNVMVSRVKWRSPGYLDNWHANRRLRPEGGRSLLLGTQRQLCQLAAAVQKPPLRFRCWIIAGRRFRLRGLQCNDGRSNDGDSEAATRAERFTRPFIRRDSNHRYWRTGLRSCRLTVVRYYSKPATAIPRSFVHTPTLDCT